MTHSIFGANGLGRLIKWPRLCALLGLLLVPAALGTDALYENDAIVDYSGDPGTYPPMIDATNFINTGTFTIDWYNINNTTASLVNYLYETWNTINYTNIGLMSSDIGFVFDTQTANVIPRQMAGSFYNPDEVDCGYQFVAWATNIMNSGTVKVPGFFTTVNQGTGATGIAGLLQFTGQNVDLSRSTLVSAGGHGTPQAVGLLGMIGIDTNSDWDATFALGPTSAYPSVPVRDFPPPPNGFGFPNRTLNTAPYFNFTAVGTNVIIISSVFIQDTSLNVSHNVYFDSGGDATVEWRGGYVDPATGNSATNYLYLHDNYIEAVATNNFNFNGIPGNFTFFESATPLFLGSPTSPGFVNAFFPGYVSNRFAYVSAELIASSAGTNDIVNRAITNLPSRIQINASSELNLEFAKIAQPDYLSLQSPNQFDGNRGARIAAPFSDINLGVTNGFLTITNLLPQSLPVWCGKVQAWSTRWTVATSNTIDGINFFIVTNDYRVEIVASQLTPTLACQVQDLILHGTNSVILSDSFNVLRKLSIDAQNLTLTTNNFGNGATSPDGELNLESPNIFWPSSLPNLLCLTNNGAISTLNLAYFGSATPTYTTNVTPAIAATATLSEVDTNGSNVATNNRVTIGTNNIYTFVGTITNTAPNQVKIAATFDGSMSNLIAAINHAAGYGTQYSTNTPANPLVTAGWLTNHSFTVTARTNGMSGDSIATTNSTATTNLTWSSASLSGGADVVTNIVKAGGPYTAFVNHGRVSNLGGSTIWANDFENYGPFFNGTNASFVLQSLNTTLAGGSIIAGGDISITATNLTASNLVLRAGRSLTLHVTNLITDTGVANGSIWSVGSAGIGGAGSGFNLPNNPTNGDLLGTTVTNIAPAGKSIMNLWAGRDFGAVTDGYTNNAAIGRLILDARGQGPDTLFNFNGTGVSNAIYVDSLQVLNYASYTNHDAVGNIPTFNFNTNLTIYYAQAITADGTSVADKLNYKNGGHLRWVTNYAGHFSSVFLTFPDGTIKAFNAALVQSPNIDSDGDGVPNGSDPTPFLASSMINLTIVSTNLPSPMERITWNTIPNATNYVYYTTDFVAWQVLTNASVSFSQPGSIIKSTPTNFVITFSSGTHSSPVPVTVSDPASAGRYYRVRVDTKQ